MNRLTFAQLSTMLVRATRGIGADFLHSTEPSLNDLYLIVHAVDDLPPGAHFYRRDSWALELLKEGNFRREAGYRGLGQDIPADCSVNIYFLADLNRALERFCNRGIAQPNLRPASWAENSTSQPTPSASGLTFFDDDVTDFFSPHAAGKSVMFLIALGKSVKKNGLNVI